MLGYFRELFRYRKALTHLTARTHTSCFYKHMLLGTRAYNGTYTYTHAVSPLHKASCLTGGIAAWVMSAVLSFSSSFQ